MTTIYETSIFIFRRDLRMHDNTGLINCLKKSKNVIPIFIFTPEQITENKYKSNNAVQFMIETIEELKDEFKKIDKKLFIFYGNNEDIIEKIIISHNIKAVFYNVDYTNYAIKRDNKIKNICNNYDVVVEEYEDYLLHSMNSIKTGSDTIYTKFTPYYNKAINEKVINPLNNKYKNYYNGTIKNKYKYKKDIHMFYQKNDNIACNGGRKNGLKMLNKIKTLNDYNKTRNILSLNTSLLSPYIKFGCISIREVYYKIFNLFGKKNDLVKQLIWRDFYYNVGYNYKNTVPPLKHAMKEKYDDIEWKKNNKYLNAWKTGQTGYPIIDACMRQLNETGFMHNRGRLIVASFLVKTLAIDWKEGDKYFSQKLIDHDPIVNCSNWQWIAGSGVDSQPYFRIFNPMLQSEKFDINCEYIKYWLPELNNVSNKDIHNCDIDVEKYNISYPEKIINYSQSKEIVLKMYKKALT
jgi:deoxyribodipyrimidine photo-lyase